jgi:hypothetical protein
MSTPTFLAKKQLIDALEYRDRYAVSLSFFTFFLYFVSQPYHCSVFRSSKNKSNDDDTGKKAAMFLRSMYYPPQVSQDISTDFDNTETADVLREMLFSSPAKHRYVQ